MKKLKSATVAVTLAAVFALSTAVSAQDSGKPDNEGYDALKSRLEAIQAQHEARKAAIAEELKARDPDLSPEMLELKTEQRLSDELDRQSQDRWRGLQSDEQGAPYIDLPEAFYKAVRGCTTDGQIWRITYNLTVNFEELAAPPSPDTALHERSLLHRLIQPNPDSVLGVSGTDRFIDALKSMTGGIHNSMQVVTGRLIDEAPASFLEGPIFNEILQLATQEITEDFREKHGVTFAIRTDKPRQQAGRCEPIAPPELLPQGQMPQ